MTEERKKHLKNNVPNKYRLNSYSNYNEHKAYYVLTKGKYKIIYASISFRSMIKFIKENNINFYEIHMNNMTLEDFGDYCDIDDRFGVDKV